MQLRQYQQDAIAELFRRFDGGSKAEMLVAPTGSGKTVMAAEIIKKYLAEGKRCMLMAHRKELIDQPSRLLDQLGIRHSVIKGTHWREDLNCKVQIASIQTLTNRIVPPCDVVIIDEAHRARAKTYETELDKMPLAIIVGLTATPWRLDKKGLGSRFEGHVVAAQPADLVAQGYLIEPETYAPTAPNMSRVRKQAGDWNMTDMAMAMQKSVLVGDVVKHWKRLSGHAATVLFASGIEHSKRLVAAFVAAGIPAAHVDGTMTDSAREGVLEGLASGRYTVVSNCDLITEGYDLPKLGCAILARPTESATKYLQMVGRIMRPVEGKTRAVVIDHAGCTLRHGLSTEHRDYSLTVGDNQTLEPRVLLPRVCKRCFAVIAPGKPACAICGYVSVAPRPMPEEKEGELQRITGHGNECQLCGCNGTLVLHRIDKYKVKVYCRECGNIEWKHDKDATRSATQSDKVHELARLNKIAKKKGYKENWAGIKYRLRFGDWPSSIIQVHAKNLDEVISMLPDAWKGNNDGDPGPF